jgi:hypothetical protein
MSDAAESTAPPTARASGGPRPGSRADSELARAAALPAAAAATLPHWQPVAGHCRARTSHADCHGSTVVIESSGPDSDPAAGPGRVLGSSNRYGRRPRSARVRVRRLPRHGDSESDASEIIPVELSCGHRGPGREAAGSDNWPGHRDRDPRGSLLLVTVVTLT